MPDPTMFMLWPSDAMLTIAQTTDNDKEREANWGKLACEILSVNWDSAMEEITKIKENIENRLFANPLAQLQHRTWLIHWSLFPLFNYDSARETLTDMLFTPQYINTIQTNCPWILRYLAAAVITNRNKTRNSNQYQRQLKDLIRIVRQEGYEYNDPVTDFIKALYIDFDFEEAQKKLSETEEILKNDFFLLGAADSFVDSARHLISESYCKIHQRIDIKYVSSNPFSDFLDTNIPLGTSQHASVSHKMRARSGSSTSSATPASTQRSTTRPAPWS
jgi:translation initiation factor 3 subunit E